MFSVRSYLVHFYVCVCVCVLSYSLVQKSYKVKIYTATNYIYYYFDYYRLLVYLLSVVNLGCFGSASK